MPLRRHRGSGPEYNLIQNPELGIRMRKRLGIRQAHVLPTLNEGIQSVVIVDDLSKHAESTAPARHCYGSVLSLVGNGVDGYNVGLTTPIPTAVLGTKIARVRRVMFSFFDSAATPELTYRVTWSVFHPASSLTFDGGGTAKKRFSHIQETREALQNTPRCSLVDRFIAMPVGPIGVEFFLVDTRSWQPFVLEFPGDGVKLLPDCFLDIDICRGAAFNLLATQALSTNIEWTEEDPGQASG